MPQYLPGQPSFSDASDSTTMPFVESVQAAPGGPLFIQHCSGRKIPTLRFSRPFDRCSGAGPAAGLRAQAEGQSTAPLAVLDVLSIPSQLAWLRLAGNLQRHSHQRQFSTRKDRSPAGSWPMLWLPCKNWRRSRTPAIISL